MTTSGPGASRSSSRYASAVSAAGTAVTAAFARVQSERKKSSWPASRTASVERVPGERISGDGAAIDQMFLDDAFEHFRRARVVPDAFRIDHRDRAGGADLEAVRLGARDQGLRADETELFEAALEEFP